MPLNNYSSSCLQSYSNSFSLDSIVDKEFGFCCITTELMLKLKASSSSELILNSESVSPDNGLTFVNLEGGL